jgi:hypothetical protein
MVTDRTALLAMKSYLAELPETTKIKCPTCDYETEPFYMKIPVSNAVKLGCTTFQAFSLFHNIRCNHISYDEQIAKLISILL